MVSKPASFNEIHGAADTGFRVRQQKFDNSRRKCCYGRTRHAVEASCQKNSGVFQEITARLLLACADSTNAYD